MYDAQYVYIRSVSSLPMLSPLQHQLKLKLVCCKKQPKKSYWPVTGCRNRGPLKYLNDSKLIVYESKLFTWSSRINFIPFRIFRGPLFHKPVTDQELLQLFFRIKLFRISLIPYYPKKVTFDTNFCTAVFFSIMN